MYIFLYSCLFYKDLYKCPFHINSTLISPASWHCFAPAALWFSPALFFFLLLLSFFLLLIPSDIPYLKADTVSPVVYSLFLPQHDLMCLSNNKREQRKKRGGRRERMGGWSVARYLRQSSIFFVICSPCGRKASHLLYYHQAMIRTGPDYSSLHKGKLILQGRVCMCVCVCKAMSWSPKTPGDIFSFYSLMR